MGWKRNSREEDERLLWMIRRRVSGLGSGEIGNRIGMTSAAVRIQTTRVREADRIESGEPEHVVNAAYWGQA